MVLDSQYATMTMWIIWDRFKIQEFINSPEMNIHMTQYIKSNFIYNNSFCPFIFTVDGIWGNNIILHIDSLIMAGF